MDLSGDERARVALALPGGFVVRSEGMSQAEAVRRVDVQPPQEERVALAGRDLDPSPSASSDRRPDRLR